ncbi:PRC-barrel domain-containing protein [Nitrobacter sp.]|uniref:PRC-barrel domain-containing protein n=1 Tax=Nitrobacter sp. TaxID=29420 RepID=UPI0029CAB205|nr:PRC-barrel domain-containing protein [Nitrobacter sp.]
MSRTGSTKAVLSIAVLVLAATHATADDAAQPQAGPAPASPPVAASPPAAAKPSDKATAPPPSITVIGPADAHSVLGREVRSTSGQDMGRIVDVIVDRAGAVRAAVIDFGGFLGVGSRKIVVDWNALRFGKVKGASDSISLELTQDQVKAAPEYKEGAPVVVLGASGTLQPLNLGP